MLKRAVLAFLIGLGLSCGAVTARAAASSDLSARQLAAAIEQRADKSSFADLEAFGKQASLMQGREALRRLQHVAWVLVNQSEFDRFEYWNGVLLAKARRRGDQRYEAMAEINELKSQYDRGGQSPRARLAALADSSIDWLARVHAMEIEADVMVQEEQAGAALKRLFAATAIIPPGQSDKDTAEARSEIWQTIGIALLQLSDLEGSARAFQKADFEFADPAYPRPDFDDIYNMTHLAVQIGDADLARDLGAIHHRLARRSDLPHLAAWDKNLCAMVAESFGSPAQVMACMAGLDGRLTGAEFLASRLLPMRAIAAARLGDLERARMDLATFRALKAAHKFPAAAFNREPQMAGELLAAEGNPGEAVKVLRADSQQRSEDQASLFSLGVHEVTTELQNQLQSVQDQAALESAVVRSQRGLELLGALLVAGAVTMLILQRRNAKRLRAAHQKAEAASRSKSEFLANMSHEIRTPLNGVVGVADMLAAANLPERERKMAEIIRSSGQSLERLLSDVLDLARVEAGQLAIETAPFHTGDLVRAVATLTRLRAEEKGLLLDEDIAPELEGWVLGDAVRVRQILINLVTNAVKFTERGAVTIHAGMTEDGRLRLEVVDTGVGFDPAMKERLFGRFQQADGSITRRFGGSGLGLAISRQLASLMGGHLDCESRPGLGSRFWFEAAFTPCDAPVEDIAKAAAPDHDRRIRVLVADDHSTNQTVVRMILEQFGHEVVVVDNGAEALAAIQHETFDVVLMDMQMPVMGGLEATRAIRAFEAKTGAARTPILMLSANALSEHRDAGRLAGADGHIAKPITVTGLMRAVYAALEIGAADEAEFTARA